MTNPEAGIPSPSMTRLLLLSYDLHTIPEPSSVTAAQ